MESWTAKDRQTSSRITRYIWIKQSIHSRNTEGTMHVREAIVSAASLCPGEMVVIMFLPFFLSCLALTTLDPRAFPFNCLCECMGISSVLPGKEKKLPHWYVLKKSARNSTVRKNAIIAPPGDLWFYFEK